MRIAVDIDDVLYPWYDRAHEACLAAGLIPPGTPPPTSWQVHEDYQVSLEAWVNALEKPTLDGSLYDGAPYPGVLRSLERLVEAGHSIHLITARGWLAHGKVIKGHTIRWLEAWEVPYSSLTFAQDKTILMADVFIDDSPRNIDALIAAKRAVRIVSRPWNADREDLDRLRVLSFNDFADHVLLED